MIYVYSCEGCGQKYDVIKPVADINREELCPVSSVTMARAVVPVKIHLYGTAVQERTKQPAFGKAMTTREAQAEAKARGWVEVGNEDPTMEPTRVEYPSFTDEDLRVLTPEKIKELDTL